MMSITGTSRKKKSSQRTTKHGTRTVTQWTCDPLRTVHSLLIRLGSSLDSVFYLRVLCDGGRGGGGGCEATEDGAGGLEGGGTHGGMVGGGEGGEGGGGGGG